MKNNWMGKIICINAHRPYKGYNRIDRECGFNCYTDVPPQCLIHYMHMHALNNLRCTLYTILFIVYYAYSTAQIYMPMTSNAMVERPASCCSCELYARPGQTNELIAKLVSAAHPLRRNCAEKNAVKLT